MFSIFKKSPHSTPAKVKSEYLTQSASATVVATPVIAPVTYASPLLSHDSSGRKARKMVNTMKVFEQFEQIKRNMSIESKSVSRMNPSSLSLWYVILVSACTATLVAMAIIYNSGMMCMGNHPGLCSFLRDGERSTSTKTLKHIERIQSFSSGGFRHTLTVDKASGTPIHSSHLEVDPIPVSVKVYVVSSEPNVQLLRTLEPIKQHIKSKWSDMLRFLRGTDNSLLDSSIYF